MTGQDARRTPWRDADITMVTITGAMGVIAIVAAWFSASHTNSLPARSMWLNVAVAGFAISATGLGLWLMRGRRAVGERRVALVALEPVVAEPAPTPVHRPRPRPAGSTATEAIAVRVIGAGRVHDPNCPLVAGKQVEPATLGDGEPCGVCLP